MKDHLCERIPETKNLHCGQYFSQYTIVFHVPKWQTLINFYEFSVSFYVINVICDENFNGISEKMQE